MTFNTLSMIWFVKGSALIILVILAILMPMLMFLGPSSQPSPISIAACYLSMPTLLCYLHFKKRFAWGFRRHFFILYAWCYLLFGSVVFFGNLFDQDDPNYLGMVRSAPLILIGIYMILLIRKTPTSLADDVRSNEKQ